MLKKVKNLLYREKNIPLEKWKDQFFRKIVTHRSHKWIRDDRSFSRAFHILTNSFNEKAQRIIRGREDILFYPCEGTLGAAFSGDSRDHVVILYPDLLKILRSGIFMVGISIVAHEVGHIALNHSGRSIDRLRAQLEADYFSFLLGFGAELQYFLMECRQTPDLKVRVNHLTSLIASRVPSEDSVGPSNTGHWAMMEK